MALNKDTWEEAVTGKEASTLSDPMNNARLNSGDGHNSFLVP